MFALIKLFHEAVIVIIYINSNKFYISEVIVITDVKVNIKSFPITVSIRGEDILVECPIDTYRYIRKETRRIK